MLKQRLLTVVCLLWLACPCAVAYTLYFSAIPSRDTLQEELLYSRVAKELSMRLHMDVQFIPSRDYRDTLELFLQHKIGFAWFGGLTGLLAKNSDPGARAIVMGFEDQFFKTVLIANSATDLRRSSDIPLDLRGKTLVLGSELSTSGRLFPEFFLQQRFGQPIEKVFKNVGYSGLHEKTIKWVEQGIYDVGAVNFQIWYDMLQKGRINTARVQVIWESPPFSDYHILAGSQLEQRYGEGFRNKLQAAMLAMSANGQMMRVFGRSHFVKADNEDFADVEKAALALGIIDSNGRMSTTRITSKE